MLPKIISEGDIEAFKEYMRLYDSTKISVNVDGHKLLISPLCFAAGSSNRDFFVAMLDHWVDINQCELEGVLSRDYTLYPEVRFSTESPLHEKLIHYAAGNADSGVLEYLVENGCNVNSRDSMGRTPLMLSMLEGSISSFQYLIQHPDIDLSIRTKAGTTALEYALSQASRASDRLKGEMASEICKKSSDKVVSEVLTCVMLDTEIKTSLKKAIIPDLWRKGSFGFLADVNKKQIYDLFCRFFDVLGMDINTQDQEGWTFLHHAAQKDCKKTIHYLLRKGADLILTNNDGQHADELKSNSRIFQNPLRTIKQEIYNALCKGFSHSRTIKKARMNNTWWGLSLDNIKTDPFINTFARAAISGGNLNLLKGILLEVGNNDSEQIKNYINDHDLLSRAVICQQGEIVPYLLDQGANITQNPTVGYPNNASYLHLAVSYGLDKEAVHALVSAGADLYATNGSGQRADELEVKHNIFDDIKREMYELILARNYPELKEKYITKNRGWVTLPMHGYGRRGNNIGEGLILAGWAVLTPSRDLLGAIYNSFPSDTAEADMGALINSYGLLHLAVRLGPLKTIKWLLEHGADVGQCLSGDDVRVAPVVKRCQFDTEIVGNANVLEYAVYRRKPIRQELMELLLEQPGIERLLNTPEPKVFKTLLEHASIKGDIELVDLLLRSGAEIRPPDSEHRIEMGPVLKGKIDQINNLVNSEYFKLLESVLASDEFPLDLYTHLCDVPKNLANYNAFLESSEALHILKYVDTAHLLKAGELLDQAVLKFLHERISAAEEALQAAQKSLHERLLGYINQHNEHISKYRELSERLKGSPSRLFSTLGSILWNFRKVRSILSIRKKKGFFGKKYIDPTTPIHLEELKCRECFASNLESLEELSEETNGLLSKLSEGIEAQFRSEQELLQAKIHGFNELTLDKKIDPHIPITKDLKEKLSDRTKKVIKEGKFAKNIRNRTDVLGLIVTLLPNSLKAHPIEECFIPRLVINEMPESLADIKDIILLITYSIESIEKYIQRHNQRYLELTKKKEAAEALKVLNSKLVGYLKEVNNSIIAHENALGTLSEVAAQPEGLRQGLERLEASILRVREVLFIDKRVRSSRFSSKIEVIPATELIKLGEWEPSSITEEIVETVSFLCGSIHDTCVELDRCSRNARESLDNIRKVGIALRDDVVLLNAQLAAYREVSKEEGYSPKAQLTRALKAVQDRIAAKDLSKEVPDISLDLSKLEALSDEDILEIQQTLQNLTKLFSEAAEAILEDVRKRSEQQKATELARQQAAAKERKAAEEREAKLQEEKVVQEETCKQTIGELHESLENLVVAIETYNQELHQDGRIDGAVITAIAPLREPLAKKKGFFSRSSGKENRISGFKIDDKKLNKLSLEEAEKYKDCVTAATEKIQNAIENLRIAKEMSDVLKDTLDKHLGNVNQYIREYLKKLEALEEIRTSAKQEDIKQLEGIANRIEKSILNILNDMIPMRAKKYGRLKLTEISAAEIMKQGEWESGVITRDVVEALELQLASTSGLSRKFDTALSQVQTQIKCENEHKRAVALEHEEQRRQVEIDSLSKEIKQFVAEAIKYEFSVSPENAERYSDELEKYKRDFGKACEGRNLEGLLGCKDNLHQLYGKVRSQRLQEEVAARELAEEQQRQLAEDSRRRSSLSKKIQATIKHVENALIQDIGNASREKYQSLFDTLKQSYTVASKGIASLEDYLSEFQQFEADINLHIERGAARIQIREAREKIAAEWEGYEDLLEDLGPQILQNNEAAEQAYNEFDMAKLKRCCKKYETILEHVDARKKDAKELEGYRAEVAERKSQHSERVKAKEEKRETIEERFVKEAPMQKSAPESEDAASVFRRAPSILEIGVPQRVSVRPAVPQVAQSALGSSNKVVIDSSSYESSSDGDEAERFGDFSKSRRAPSSRPVASKVAQPSPHSNKQNVRAKPSLESRDEGFGVLTPKATQPVPELDHNGWFPKARSSSISSEYSSDEADLFISERVSSVKPLPVKGPAQLAPEYPESHDEIFTTSGALELVSKPGALKRLVSYVRRFFSFRRKSPVVENEPAVQEYRPEPPPAHSTVHDDHGVWQVGALAITNWCEAYRIGVVEKLVVCIDTHYSIDGSNGAPTGLFAQHGGISPKEEIQLRCLRTWLYKEKESFSKLTDQYRKSGLYEDYEKLCDWVTGFKETFNDEKRSLHNQGWMNRSPNNPNKDKELINIPSIIRESFHGREKGSGSFWRGVKRFFRSIKLKWKNRKNKKPLDQTYSSPRKLVAALNRVEIAESQQIGDRVICPMKQGETIHDLKRCVGRKKQAPKKIERSVLLDDMKHSRSRSRTAQTNKLSPKEPKQRRRIAEPTKRDPACRFVGHISDKQRKRIERQQEGRSMRSSSRYNKRTQGSKRSYDPSLFAPIKLPKETDAPATCPTAKDLPSTLF